MPFIGCHAAGQPREKVTAARANQLAQWAAFTMQKMKKALKTKAF